MRIIMHVDLDAFFAAVEEREHPEYRGKPIVVGADPRGGKGRGVVSTCSYDARRSGIHSSMPISNAWKLCPEVIYLPVNFELYEEVSARIMSILKPYADKFEQVGIDEAFLDVSEREKSFDDAKRLAREIKKEIGNQKGLTCSIGIEPNKLVAKMASDFKKPDGLTVVEENNARQFLSPLEVDKLPGIGPKTKYRMNKLGIRSIGELASYEVDKLIEKFGSLGVEFHRMAQGIGDSEVIEEWIPKSFSREHTFEEDVSDPSLVYTAVDWLCEELLKEIIDSNYFFKTITVKVRYEDFETHTRAKTLSFPTGQIEVLKGVVRKLLEPFLGSLRKIRLVGVKLSNFTSRTEQKILENS